VDAAATQKFNLLTEQQFNLEKPLAAVQLINVNFSGAPVSEFRSCSVAFCTSSCNLIWH
jgi:hypothetical protein